MLPLFSEARCEKWLNLAASAPPESVTTMVQDTIHI